MGGEKTQVDWLLGGTCAYKAVVYAHAPRQSSVVILYSIVLGSPFSKLQFVDKTIFQLDKLPTISSTWDCAARSSIEPHDPSKHGTRSHIFSYHRFNSHPSSFDAFYPSSAKKGA